MDKLFDLSGKVAVVTGGSRGIGAMIARGLVGAGVRTYITARREEELAATAEELGAFGECIAMPANLGSVDGEDQSSVAVRAKIRKLIGAEDRRKPLSDSKIAAILKEDGVVVARRTVAKYREAMDIPSSSQRRERSSA